MNVGGVGERRRERERERERGREGGSVYVLPQNTHNLHIINSNLSFYADVDMPPP